MSSKYESEYEPYRPSPHDENMVVWQGLDWDVADVHFHCRCLDWVRNNRTDSIARHLARIVIDDAGITGHQVYVIGLSPWPRPPCCDILCNSLVKMT